MARVFPLACLLLTAIAMALPFADASFDIATMALVIFFVPDPPKGVAEMNRVVRPGGIVASYGWELLDGGFPYAALQEEMQAIGLQPMMPPSAEAPMVRLPMAPGPVASTRGMRPAMNANEVMRIGRKRTFAPSMAASSTVAPCAVSAGPADPALMPSRRAVVARATPTTPRPVPCHPLTRAA